MIVIQIQFKNIFHQKVHSIISIQFIQSPQRFFRHGGFSPQRFFFRHGGFPPQLFFFRRSDFSATADCSRGGFPPQGEIFPLRSASGRKFSVRHAPLRPGKNLKNLHPWSYPFKTRKSFCSTSQKKQEENQKRKKKMKKDEYVSLVL